MVALAAGLAVYALLVFFSLRNTLAKFAVLAWPAW